MFYLKNLLFYQYSYYIDIWIFQQIIVLYIVFKQDLHNI